MGNKRKSSDRACSTPDVAKVGVQPTSTGFTKLDEATASYFTDLIGHLSHIKNGEERALLAANALEEAEASGKALAVATDRVCSRPLEAIIDAAPPNAICSFARCLLTPKSQFQELSISPLGSRVAQRLLRSLERSLEAVEGDAADEAQKLLSKAAAAIAESLYEMITDANGTHVARQLLVAAAGYDVTPQNSLSAVSDGTDALQALRAAHGSPPKGLAAKVSLQAEVQGSRTKLPELLLPFSRAVLDPALSGSLAEELPFHPYASPFLQSLLMVQSSNSEFLETLIPRFFGLSAPPGGSGSSSCFEDLSAETFVGMLQDRTSSHLLEVVVRVAPPGLRQDMQERFFKGQLEALARHSAANFVVQALLASITKPLEMKWVVSELRRSFPELLRSKRGGVVAAALAAAARTGTGQVELSKALSAALRQLPGNTKGVAAALLTLGGGVRLDSEPVGRLPPLGCSILASVLRFCLEASKEFTDSLLTLTPKELARVAADPSGSRALEALLESGNKKLNRKLLLKLEGSYGGIASAPAGNHLVEKCFSVAKNKEKESIAQDLALVSAQLAETPRGAKLLLRCGVEEYKRSSDAWRVRTRAAEQIKKDFSEFLEGDTTDAAESSLLAAAAQPATGDKKRKRPKPQEAEVAAGSGGDLTVSETVAALLKKLPASENTTGDNFAKGKEGAEPDSAPVVDEGTVKPETAPFERVSAAEGNGGEKAAKKRKRERTHDVEDSSNVGGGLARAAAVEGPDGGLGEEKVSKRSKKHKGEAEGEMIEKDTGRKKKKKQMAAGDEKGSHAMGEEVSIAERKAVGAVKASGKVVLEEDGLVNLQVFEDRTPKRAKKGNPSKASGRKLQLALARVALPEGWEATSTALLFMGKPSTAEQRDSLKGKAKGGVRKALKMIEGGIQKQKNKEEKLLLKQAAKETKRKADNGKKAKK